MAEQVADIWPTKRQSKPDVAKTRRRGGTSTAKAAGAGPCGKRWPNGEAIATGGKWDKDGTPLKAKSGGKKHVPGTMGHAAPFAAAGDARAMELYMVSIRGSMRKLPRVVTHTKPTRKLEPRGLRKAA